jgi:DNA-binding CsgD family transcriptional regulator
VKFIWVYLFMMFNSKRLVKPAMQKNFDPSDFEKLKSYVTNLLAGKVNKFSVSAKLQDNEMASLKTTIGSQRFFFVVDLTTFEITHQSGIERWLGYSEKDFSLKKYWKLVHPGLQKSAHIVFVQMIDILCSGKFSLQFMVQRYSSLTAIKHHNGEYLLVKRTASVFQYDKDNRLTGYLNEFTIVGKYGGEALSQVFFTNKGQPEDERGKIVMEQVLENFLGLKIFSVNEFHIARMLAYNAGITQKKIAAILSKSPNTIDTYCKRFLTKARDYFHHEFSSASEAARYLQKNGLL